MEKALKLPNESCCFRTNSPYWYWIASYGQKISLKFKTIMEICPWKRHGLVIWVVITIWPMLQLWCTRSIILFRNMIFQINYMMEENLNVWQVNPVSLIIYSTNWYEVMAYQNNGLFRLYKNRRKTITLNCTYFFGDQVWSPTFYVWY